MMGRGRSDNCVECGRYLTISARDMCHTCYIRWYRQQPGNREKIRAAARKRYAKDPEKYNARTRAGRSKEEKKQYDRQYYLENKEKIKTRSKKWKAEHPEKNVEQCRIYQARRAGCEASLTLEEWGTILDAFGHACVYCGKDAIPLVKEHWIPAYFGGAYSADNIVPGCQSCNSKKGVSTGDEYLELLWIEERSMNVY